MGINFKCSVAAVHEGPLRVRKDSFKAGNSWRTTLIRAKNGIAANVQTAAMPSINYACFLEAVVEPRAPTDAPRAPEIGVTFRTARAGLVLGKSDLS